MGKVGGEGEQLAAAVNCDLRLYPVLDWPRMEHGMATNVAVVRSTAVLCQ